MGAAQIWNQSCWLKIIPINGHKNLSRQAERFSYENKTQKICPSPKKLSPTDTTLIQASHGITLVQLTSSVTSLKNQPWITWDLPSSWVEYHCQMCHFLLTHITCIYVYMDCYRRSGAGDVPWQLLLCCMCLVYATGALLLYFYLCSYLYSYLCVGATRILCRQQMLSFCICICIPICTPLYCLLQSILYMNVLCLLFAYYLLVSVKESQGWAIQVQANMFVMCVLLLLQICARYLLWVPKKRKQSIKNHPFSQIKQKIKNPSFYRMVPQEPFQPFQPGSILQTLSGWFLIITREMLILIKAYIICALQVNVMRIHAL